MRRSAISLLVRVCLIALSLHPAQHESCFTSLKKVCAASFSLAEIAELLRLEDGTHCDEASSLAEHKLQDVREKMADLGRMEVALSKLVCACHAHTGSISCPPIASLQAQEVLRAPSAG
ncbi:MAG: hypothetical protein EPN76_01255 [Burkholderiaceae bacterium]|nr:MAG: hypothetical protein EPN76_01255 [Burkholderiaceae bacterium]TAM09685.1 MAG: hypothetical protein EPN67_01445 [Pusillimonas sp.]